MLYEWTRCRKHWSWFVVFARKAVCPINAKIINFSRSNDSPADILCYLTRLRFQLEFAKWLSPACLFVCCTTKNRRWIFNLHADLCADKAQFRVWIRNWHRNDPEADETYLRCAQGKGWHQIQHARWASGTAAGKLHLISSMKTVRCVVLWWATGYWDHQRRRAVSCALLIREKDW